MNDSVWECPMFSYKKSTRGFSACWNLATIFVSSILGTLFVPSILGILAAMFIQ